MAETKKRRTGNDWRKKNGFKSMMVHFDTEQHDRLMLAAHAEKRSMVGFILYHTLEAIKRSEKKEFGT